MRKKIVIGLLLLSILLIGIGVTFAYISNRVLSTPTTVTFSVNPNYRCNADGGGDITSNDAGLAPASCTNPNYAIQRVIKVNPQIDSNGTKVYMDLWLEIKDLGQGLSNSHNFKWALTTNPSSCTDNVVRSGNFYKYQIGEKINILKDVSFTRTTTDTYYLYVWLDLKESSRTTMNQTFHLTLNGDCNDDYINEETYLYNNGRYQGSSNDDFLRTGLKRNEIVSVTFVDSIEGHSVDDENCTDAGNVENGKILAWITPSTEYEGLYDAIIGQEGGVIAPVLSSYLFQSLNNVIRIDVSKLDTSRVTSMISMFQSDSKLISLNIENWDTYNVARMDQMFWGCQLISLNVSKFNTSKVTTMFHMFRDCNKLNELDVSNFDTSNVVNMGYMFGGCNSLISLDVSNFDTANVKTMAGMFMGCHKITYLDVSHFNTSKVTNMIYMFHHCYALTSLDVSNFDTSKSTNVNMFAECRSLKTIDLSNFDLSSVEEGNMFNFYNTNKLSDESLNSILLAVTTATKVTTKKISDFNYSESRVSKLSNYQAFLDAGWTL